MHNILTLMVQGTTSDAGKSTLVAGLCRVFARRGIAVAPFKPQNMALNSAVTVDGGEIGRAQAVQALACYQEPHTDFNPVLLKPNNDVGAQIIIHGKAIGNMEAVDYHAYKTTAMNAVLSSYRRLQDQYQAVIIEGAGSPSEINLRANDIANMGFAERVDCPVILIADIDRGGVFAHIVGTLELLSESERSRVIGFVINKFRGDIALLQSGLDWLEQRTGKPVLGVLPYLQGIHIEAEDSLPRSIKNVNSNAVFRIIVPALPRISNHTDFDALRLIEEVDFQWIGPDAEIPPADLIILPGSKSVRSDLAWLRNQGWDKAIQRHLRFGGKVLGICGGFQMLGQYIHDPDAIEGPSGSSAGLGLLDIETTLYPTKQLHRVQGSLTFANETATGYEIHAGVSSGPGLQHPLVKLSDRNDGAISVDSQVAGTYLHGIFDQTEAREALLRWSGLSMRNSFDYYAYRDNQINRLADAVDQHLDIKNIENLAMNFKNSLRVTPSSRDLTLVLGGVRSGKSRYAEQLAIKSLLPVTYIATATALDDEMKTRIELHRARRQAGWQTVEEPRLLAATIKEFAKPNHCVVVDCLTMWLTNLLLDKDSTLLQHEVDALIEILNTVEGKLILVGNETNMGIIPVGEITRRFGDEAGALHQRVAQFSSHVILMVAGLPVVVKS